MKKKQKKLQKNRKLKKIKKRLLPLKAQKKLEKV